MGIISRQLKENMKLLRGKETLVIKSLIRTGRSCTAVVKNSKGKEEKLTITDMWNQKVSIADGVDKPKKEAKVPIKRKETKLQIKRVETARGKGIHTAYYDASGKPLFSSWKRTSV